MYTYTTFISKRDAERVRFNELSSSTILISLNSPLNTPGTTEANFVDGVWSKILRLEFHDADLHRRSIDHRLETYDPDQIVLFDESQAIEIFHFLKQHQHTHSQVIVHCEGGVSRSAAVSKFIAQIYGLQFPESYSLYNRHVYTTLLQVYGRAMYEEGSITPEDLPGLEYFKHEHTRT